MLKVDLSEIKPIAKKVLNNNSKAKIKTVNSITKPIAEKAIPSIVLLGNGIYALTANKTENTRIYEFCSDFCGEVLG